jgi:hypothetical protein
LRMNELENRDRHSHEQREHRVSRRELLGRMAAGVAAWICTAERSRAQSDGNPAAWARTVKIGLHQAGWGTRPLRELFTAARELGYDGVELAPPWLEKKHDMERVYRLLVAPGRFVFRIRTVYSRTSSASSHPFGVEKAFTPRFSKSPILLLSPVFGSMHQAQEVAADVILPRSIETVAALER